VGAYTGSASPCGAYDMGGNVFQWNEEILNSSSAVGRSFRGGSWYNDTSALAASSPGWIAPPDQTDGVYLGFRVATIAPMIPPIANAGPNQTVHTKLVTLDGSGSSDPSGLLPLSYAWSFISKPAGSAATSRIRHP